MSGGSGGKKRSGFQITSVTSEGSQSAQAAILSVTQGAPTHGSSSQPTTPSLKRKPISQDALGQGVGCMSRFRVVRLAVGGPGSRGRAQPYRRGRWTCTEFAEHQEGAGLRRVMYNMRHAHSLESLEMIGRDKDRGGVSSQPSRAVGGAGLVLKSGPPSPTHQEPISIQLLDHNKHLDSAPLPMSPHSQHTPPPLRLDMEAPPPLRLDMEAAGRSVLRLSHSPPGTLTSIQTTGSFNLDHLIQDTSSTNSLVAIDNKIEQAMNLVKSHLMLAVREEVELLRERIRELQEKNTQLERENHILRTIRQKTD